MMENDPISVLVAPLDWGLGHATRCIPIIYELIHHKARVVVAANQAQIILLKSEFPDVEFIETESYNIRYSGGIFLKWALFFRIPSMLKQIKHENGWLENILRHRHIDAVISDNRYGLYHKACYSVFITHQLQIQSGFGSTVLGRYINRQILKWHYAFIEKFSSCWIPDLPGELSVAGALSHPARLPLIPVKYIGILSRFFKTRENIQKNSLLILLSGPEPQRTIFENILLNQLANSSLNAVMVRGLPGSVHPTPSARAGLQIWNHLSSNALGELINNSEYIIARSGYSTVMDLLAVKKNAILIPTPGQTEQEYLGHYLHEKKWMYTIAQKDFNLPPAMSAFKNAGLIQPEIPHTNLQGVITEFLGKLP
ncbi:MAG TPA: glycosyltransferase, partial [Puia sp.]|nr:glycosyltransferase [Puia sp.]